MKIRNNNKHLKICVRIIKVIHWQKAKLKAKRYKITSGSIYKKCTYILQVLKNTAATKFDKINILYKITV